MSSLQPLACSRVDLPSRCIWNIARLTSAGTFWNCASMTACCERADRRVARSRPPCTGRARAARGRGGTSGRPASACSKCAFASLSSLQRWYASPALNVASGNLPPSAPTPRRRTCLATSAQACVVPVVRLVVRDERVERRVELRLRAFADVARAAPPAAAAGVAAGLRPPAAAAAAAADDAASSDQQREPRRASVFFDGVLDFFLPRPRLDAASWRFAGFFAARRRSASRSLAISTFSVGTRLLGAAAGGCQRRAADEERRRPSRRDRCSRASALRGARRRRGTRPCSSSRATPRSRASTRRSTGT